MRLLGTSYTSGSAAARGAMGLRGSCPAHASINVHYPSTIYQLRQRHACTVARSSRGKEEVVVIGGGAAGLTAAYFAAQAGAQVRRAASRDDSGI